MHLSDFFALDADSSQILPGTYSYPLVLLSYLIAVLGSYTFLQFADRIVELGTSSVRFGWLIGGAVAMGGGVWAMHFIGMLAYLLPIPVSYDVWVTLLSMVPAVLAAGVALHVVARPRVSMPRTLVGGTLMGLGIGTMHYAGMAALKLNAFVRYDPVLFATSIVAAVALAILALQARFVVARTRLTKGKELLGAMILGFAVAGMHYTAMASTYCFAAAGQQRNRFVFDPSVFALITALVASLVLVIAIVAVIFDRRVAVESAKRREVVNSHAQTREQLIASQQRYQMLFDASPNTKALVDVETRRIIEVNDAALSMFGYERDEMIGMHADELFDPGVMPLVERDRQRDDRHALAVTPNLKLLRNDGTIFYAEIATRQIEVEGKPVTLAVAWDVTRRVEAEDQLRQSQQRYQQMFEANPDPLTLVDGETYLILAVNDAMVKQYGWSREELTGMHVDRLSRPEDLPEIRRLRKARQVLRTDIRQVRKDGRLFDAEAVVNQIKLDGRPTMLAVVRDVTARLDAERQRDAVEAQLQQAQKMEAVGQLTGGVAHDFNNILMVIMANVEELLEDETLSSGQRTMLQTVVSSGERAAELTRRLLAFSRKQRLEPQLTNINELVTSVSKMLRRTLGENIEIESVLASDLGIANVDRAQVESVLLNLSVNARDAMPAGGRLIIETANQELDQEYVEVHPEAKPGAYVMLEVSDTGAGISRENLQRVFEPFFTTKEVGKGTGLGLSMVYGFVKQSNGHIKIYSEIGRGTTIRIYLPRIDAELKADEEKAAATPQGTERLLVVEDDDLVRKSVVAQLRSLGYEVAEFARGRQALEWLDRGGQPDLVLTDVVMPEMDGPTVARMAEKLRPGVKILFMSGYSENSSVQHNNVPAGAQLLSKPFRKIDLAKRIRDVLTQNH